MSDTDPKVSLTTESASRKEQWGSGLLYRDDGRKKTLVSKKVLWLTVIGFGVVAVSLLFDSPPEKKKTPKSLGDFAPPSGVGSAPLVHVPEAAKLDGSRLSSREDAPHDEHGKAGAHSGERAPRYRGPQVVSRPRAVKIPPASLVKAVLRSGASNGPVRAEVTEGLTVAGELLIPTGTILLGQGQSGQERLAVQFKQMVFPDGAVETVDAQACDASDKIAGLKGSRVGDQAKKLMLAIGLNFAGGASEALQDSVGEYGAVVRPPSLRNAALNGAGTAALSQSTEMMSEIKNKPPVYEIPAETPIFVLFQKE